MKLTIGKVICYLVAIYFFYLMLEITLRYIPLDREVAFLAIKQEEVQGVPGYLPLFYVHVYSAILVLLCCFTQFSTYLLKTYPAVHRLGGKLYVFIVLFLAAPSGLFIGFFANGGGVAVAAFLLLAILWFYFTWQGLRAIQKGDVAQHRAMMLCSFSLAFSAVTLRLWKVILVYFFEPAPMDLYRVIAWLGWVPNLLLIICYLTIKSLKNEKNPSVPFIRRYVSFLSTEKNAGEEGRTRRRK
ncbi:DUF2306 domain-containing protein [Rhinopithecimicrobium faecis]|uniref:DUF2306 domain-containing protein n=1 Tax=Rhinopithecimicrobium faecis TaxID=2820698 RepID=UPI0033658070